MARTYHPIARMAVIPLAAAILVAGAGEARAKEAKSALAALKPGTLVSLNQWTGPDLHGELMEITDCALVLRVSSEPVTVPLDRVRTVKRHSPRKTNRAARVMTDIASYCDDPGCAPGALLYLGVAAVIKSFDDLALTSKVVYRVKKPPLVTPSCDAPVRLARPA